MQRISLKDDVKFRKEYFGAFILNPKNMDIYFCNNTGRIILENMKEYVTVDELSKKLSHRFNIHLKKCKTDIKSFINGLKSHDLINIKG